MMKRLSPWVLAGLAAIAGCDRERPRHTDGDLMAFPGALDFARVALHGDQVLDVELQNLGRSTLSVEEIALEGAVVYSVEPLAVEPARLEPDQRATLRVHFQPVTPGAQAAALVVRTDSLRSRQLRIPLTGVGVDARATVSAEALDFGRIEAQSRTVRALTFQNTTDIRIQVSVRPTGADADEFLGTTVALGPFERSTAVVTFAPRRVGVKSAGLLVAPCAGCGEVPVRVTAEALDRAVVADPWGVDFKRVPMDRLAEEKVTLHNISTEPMTLNGAGVEAAADPGYFAGSLPSFPLVMGAGEVRSLPVGFSPGHLDRALGAFAVLLRSVRNPWLSVPLSGQGGAADLCITPSLHHFGSAELPVPVGAKISVKVNLKNCGVMESLDLTAIAWGGGGLPGEDQFSLASSLSLPLQLAPGEQVEARAFYEPTRAGDSRGRLRALTAQYPRPFEAELQGHAFVSDDCKVSYTPPVLDYGTLPPGEGAVLGVRIRAEGTGRCAVKNIRMVDTGGGAFWLPGRDIEGVLLNPGEAFGFMVAFRAPRAGGSATGLLQIESADPRNPRTLIPLLGNAQASCVVSSPRFLDFGLARPDCVPPPRQVTLLNTCSAPAEVTEIAIGSGTTSGEFRIVAAPPTPLWLVPGRTVGVSVEYRPQVGGLNLSPLQISTAGLPAPYLVPLVGEASLWMTQVDSYIQQDPSKLDVLFVVDNTASMVEEQPRLVRAIPAFVSAALARGVDLHVAVTTTGIEPVSTACPGGAMGGEAGRFFPVDGSSERVLTHRSPDLVGRLQRNVQVGLCAYVEQGLEAMQKALSEPLASSPAGNGGFLRSEAPLAVVFVGDEDDNSGDGVDAYVSFVQARKGPGQQRVALFAIAPTEAGCATAGAMGTRYADAVRRTGGAAQSICQEDYGSLLRQVAQKVFMPQSRFPLSATPAPGSIVVRVNGAVTASGWSHDAAANAVVFATPPAPGARIELGYRLPCP